MAKKQENPMSEAMYYIMLALMEPLHGYAIMEKVNELSQGRIEVGPGTLYGILKRLEKDRWIALWNSDGRRKVYILTATGKAALQHEYERLKQMVGDGKRRVKGENWDE